MTATTALSLVVTAAPAAAAHRGPRPVSHWIPAVPAQESTWVHIYWTTDRKICDAEVTVDGDDVQVGYPSNTDPFTSFRDEARLRPRHDDYTAIRVYPQRPRAVVVPVVATLKYNRCHDGDEQLTREYLLFLPVLGSDSE